MRSRNSHWAVGLTLALLAGCARSESSNQEVSTGDASFHRVRSSGVLRWGADVVGGVPYVYENPKHPGEYVGFEMEIGRAIARRLGVRLELVVKAWDTLIPELQRGTFDMGMNGIEDTPERSKIVLFSHPYYVYSQQITVRKETKEISGLADLKGRRVATLSGSAAEDILRSTPGIQAVVHPEIIYSYEELEKGKVDAVLLDKPIAVAYGASNPRLKNAGTSFQEGRYVIVFRKQDAALRDSVNSALQEMIRSGELKTILSRYGLMDDFQTQIGVR